MSFLVKRSTLSDLIPADRRRAASAGPSVSADTALRNSALWACLRIRADLISTLPVDVYRKTAGIRVELPPPPLLVQPGGERVGIEEWLYSSQIDLDRVGNSYGLITERNSVGTPTRIDLQPHDQCGVRQAPAGTLTYKIAGKVVATEDVWHERQFTLAGLPIGLSPIAYAAWSLGLWRSSIEFGQQYFDNHGTIPTGHLKNTEKVLDDGVADKIKARYRVAVEGGDIFVTGKDWDFNTKDAPSADARFLDAQGATDRDMVRFFGVPGDLVEVNAEGSSITYANVTQRNLQFLIMNLGPAIVRREKALSKPLGAPRYVKLNTAALLRMDPQTVSERLVAEVGGKITAPSEARATMDRGPFTEEQLAEFDALGITHAISGAITAGVGAGSGSAKNAPADDAAQARAVAELIQKIYLGVGVVIDSDEARTIANRAGAGLVGSLKKGPME